MNDEIAQNIKDRLARLRIWRESINNRSYKSDDVPLDCRVTNEEISALEIYEFKNQIPDKYSLYIKESTREAITWIGDKLGDVEFGNEWKDNFGGTRQAIRIKAINGRQYYGVYYKSSGDYARIKLLK